MYQGCEVPKNGLVFKLKSHLNLLWNFDRLCNILQSLYIGVWWQICRTLNSNSGEKEERWVFVQLVIVRIYFGVLPQVVLRSLCRGDS